MTNYIRFFHIETHHWPFLLIEALVTLATDELTSYKRPREFRVVDSLPRNAMGKVVRRDLT